MQLFYIPFNFENVIAVVPFTEYAKLSEIADVARSVGMRTVVELVDEKKE